MGDLPSLDPPGKITPVLLQQFLYRPGEALRVPGD